MSAVPALASTTGARPLMYRRLAEPFLFPNEQRTSAFISGAWQGDVQACAQHLGFTAPDVVPLSSTPAEFETEFIALHEVGMGGAPCPLHSGHYARDRMKTMEEVLRFYRFFDYQPERSADRFPDHLSFELEFMAHLAEVYETALASGGDAESPLLAQNDFISRNLGSWVPQLRVSIDQRCSIEFCRQAGRLLEDFVVHDSEALQQLAVGDVHGDDQNE